MKRRKLHTVAAIFSLSLFLYNAVLIGGGRGPFALYEDFWTCHCNDSYTIGDEQADEADWQNPDLSLALKGTDGEAVRSSDQSASGDEMCRAPRPSDENAASGVCKRKLPIKYLSLLSVNSAFIFEMTTMTRINPNYLFASLLDDAAQSPLAGRSHNLIKPPRV